MIDLKINSNKICILVIVYLYAEIIYGRLI